MNEESALKAFAKYLLMSHNLYCNQIGLQYWHEYIDAEVERLRSGSHRELTELELHRIAKDMGISVEELRNEDTPVLTS